MLHFFKYLFCTLEKFVLGEAEQEALGGRDSSVILGMSPWLET
jgi:hypothetical protein